jgi:hypothetical protein
MDHSGITWSEQGRIEGMVASVVYDDKIQYNFTEREKLPKRDM